eukprot:TRINITY_DN21903_c0_g1_i1.p1 TRINITY_DN21903_c0_g1~~TRINITY_DN21903_c0_g1_i1.p1  ORF type:complete len:765 (-),score=162.79 TRINITY_DN21903_c0_g1_i1:190-2484(-)
MADQQGMVNILVIWRGKQLNVEMSSNSTVKELAHKLQNLTNVKPETMRLIVPRSTNAISKLLTPFSDDEHANLSLQETAIIEGKNVRMMGVFENEIEEVSQNNMKPDMRIAGFDEEEKRLRQRALVGPQTSLKLPQGTYIFCDFRTLHIPGIELNPPASEALRRMHMLATDPGIIAIMNKHRWRVGIMTEMAPVGYVGVNPKCILGFNKNHGEEISLRLRTDDLKGFRKYESIKKTLLHELAHMVYSEHDADFFALDSQLNREAVSFDWTKSRSHTLTGLRPSNHYEDDFHVETNRSGHKLGGNTLNSSTNARVSSVAAAYHRFLNVSSNTLEGVQVQPDSAYADGGNSNKERELDLTIEPDPDDGDFMLDRKQKYENENIFEPDPDDSQVADVMESEPYLGINRNRNPSNPGFDDSEISKSMLLTGDMSEPNTEGSVMNENTQCEPHLRFNRKFPGPKMSEEPDPDDSCANKVILEHEIAAEPDPDDSQSVETFNDENQMKLSSYMFPEKTQEEPDPDDCVSKGLSKYENCTEPDPDDSQENDIMEAEPDPDDNMDVPMGTKPEKEDSGPSWERSVPSLLSSESHGPCGLQTYEPDPDDTKENSSGAHKAIFSPANFDTGGHNTTASGDSWSVMKLSSEDQELQRISDSVSVVCTRLQKAIEILRSEIAPAVATSVLQTLFKIIRNVIEHPDEMKFRRLRKANPLFQRNVASYKAAMDVLLAVGFHEDVASDGIGRTESYLVLKRNDPGLLWLAKSSLEECIA